MRSIIHACMILVAFVALVSPSQATIVIDSTATGSVDSAVDPVSGNRSEYTLQGFDANGSDKLVVAFMGEARSDGGNPATGVSGVTYNGVPLMVAGFVDSAAPQLAGIYFLDNPGTAGDIIVDWDGNTNGIGFGVYALSGTQSGAPAVSLAGDSLTNTIAASAGDLVIASAVSNTQTTLSGDSDFTDLLAPNTATGSSRGAVEHFFPTAAGNVEYTLAATNPNNFRPSSVLATFQMSAVPEPSSFLFLSLIAGLCGTRRSRS